MAIRYHFGYGCTANLSKAKELYNKALYWNSNIAENNLGAIFMKEGNLEQAKRLFNRAIAEKAIIVMELMFTKLFQWLNKICSSYKISR